jgi:hypothetical protein
MGIGGGSEALMRFPRNGLIFNLRVPALSGGYDEGL